jgi:hypothetical protein
LARAGATDAHVRGDGGQGACKRNHAGHREVDDVFAIGVGLGDARPQRPPAVVQIGHGIVGGDRVSTGSARQHGRNGQQREAQLNRDAGFRLNWVEATARRETPARERRRPSDIEELHIRIRCL